MQYSKAMKTTNSTKEKIIKNKYLFRAYQYYKRWLRLISRPVKGKNNSIINNGILQNVKIDIIGENNQVHIGQGSIVNKALIYIRGNNHILTIGNQCRFGGGELWFEDGECMIKIGDHTTVESAHIAVTEPGRQISIGKDCMLSKNIEIRTGDSHSIIDKISGKRINYAADVIISDHVWIGANTTILKGVHIDKGVTIGTHSLVTKSIPSNCIAAGIPAKVVKEHTDWIKERIYDSQ